MTTSLPANPNLEQLKKQAKDLLKTFKAGDPSVCEVLRYHYRFARASDETILKSELTLQEAQHALALDYGFRSWAHMTKQVAQPSDAPAEDGAGSAARRCVVNIMEEAFKSRASDIHLEWHEGQLLVRYRIDGGLQDLPGRIPADLQTGIIKSLKQMCSMDMDARTHPQNGRIHLQCAGRSLDFRVSIMPYVSGESAVIRILDRANVTIGLDEQDLSPANLAMIRSWKNRPNGIFFISGPTGSGKTTTMYSVLRSLDPKKRKIITCEEPVEYTMEGINQQNVDPDSGLPLTKVLREVMRQDPDVIMIGEMRDRESLDAAIQLALTGHLVFSCMHTNDAADGVRRLVEVAPEPYRLNSCLIGGMAQRLVRKICPDCREEYEPEPWALEPFAGTDSVRCFKGAGCDACKGSGYRGRTAIQELLEMDGDLRSIIAKGEGLEQIREQAIKSGMITMRQDGLAKVVKGITTIDEVLRVTDGNAY